MTIGCCQIQKGSAVRAERPTAGFTLLLPFQLLKSNRRWLQLKSFAVQLAVRSLRGRCIPPNPALRVLPHAASGSRLPLHYSSQLQTRSREDLRGFRTRTDADAFGSPMLASIGILLFEHIA